MAVHTFNQELSIVREFELTLTPNHICWPYTAPWLPEPWLPDQHPMIHNISHQTQRSDQIRWFKLAKSADGLLRQQTDHADWLVVFWSIHRRPTAHNTATQTWLLRNHNVHWIFVFVLIPFANTTRISIDSQHIWSTTLPQRMLIMN